MLRPSPSLPAAPGFAPADDPLPRAREGVVFQRVPGGAVLLSTTDEVYFGLNAVGADIWELLPPAASRLGELCARVLERYPDAPEADVRADVLDLLAALRDAGLVADGAAA